MGPLNSLWLLSGLFARPSHVRFWSLGRFSPFFSMWTSSLIVTLLRSNSEQVIVHTRMQVKSKVTEARVAAGLTLEEAARRARVCVAYVRRAERQIAPYTLALRLSHIYGCRIDTFLHVGATEPRTSPGERRNAPGKPQ